MTRNNGNRGIREFPIDEVEIGTAHPACQDPDENLGWSGSGLLGLEWLDAAETRSSQRHRLHRVLFIDDDLTIPAGMLS
jgi:hypothetical protein